MAASVLSPTHRRLTVGLIAAITLVGFENLGVTTAMPEAAKQLGGERWYGWAFAAAMLGQLVALAASGADVDSRGPKRSFLAGLAALLVGLVIGSIATHIAQLLIARFIVGVGAGAVFTCSYAVIGLGYDEEIRPKMLAVTSSAWVVPGLVGPSVAGWLTDTYSWRWVLAGVIPIVPIAAFVVGPGLNRLSRPSSTVGPDLVAELSDGSPAEQEPFWTLTGPQRTLRAVACAICAVVVLGGLSAVDRPLVVAGCAATGLAGLVVVLRSGLVPRATLRAAPGLGAVVVASACLLGAFTGSEAFVPLALQRLRGLSSTEAGFAISAGTITWFLGSWLHSRNVEAMRNPLRARLAVGLLATGFAGVALLAVDSMPTVVSIIMWGAGGLGMGLAYNLLSERPFQLVDTAQIGIVGSAVQIANALGSSLAAGIGGALVAATEVNGEATGRGIAWALSTQIVTAAGCAALLGRALAKTGTE
jgi:MFS family permease